MDYYIGVYLNKWESDERRLMLLRTVLLHLPYMSLYWSLPFHNTLNHLQFVRGLSLFFKIPRVTLQSYDAA